MFRLMLDILGRVGIMLGWILLGGVFGFISMAVYYIVWAGIAGGGFPPTFIHAALVGGGVGFLVGLFNAGLRLYVKG